MDEDGFAFTPMSFLMIIPVLVIAISYGNIINEANLVGSIVIGGDVTYSAASTLFSAMQKGAGDAGRNSAYNATRKVIDDHSFFANGQSKTYVKNNVINALNTYIVNATLEVEQQTGREIYINGILIDDYSDAPFNSGNVYITQTDPYGFYVNIKGGIPIKIVQQDSDQVYELTTPDSSTYVSIQGLEDPYVWIYTKYRSSNVIYKYPYYTYSDTYGYDYYFDVTVDTDLNRLNHLWDCLNGTENPSTISPRPYYFGDPEGLSFFDRLEGKNTSTEPDEVKMSSFIIGDPLLEDHGTREISKIDHEYITGVRAYYILKIGNDEVTDPDGSFIYLSQYYGDFLGFDNNYLKKVK
ncbi:MAG: hypothetical protein ACP5OJ_09155 [Methanothermobacter sp.]